MKYKYWISNISGISAAKIRILLKEFDSEENVYFASEEDLLAVANLTEEDVRNIIDSRKYWNPDEKWGAFLETGINFVDQSSKEYPERLKNIVNPPYSFYYIGRLPKENLKTVAMVGARGRTEYGGQVACELSYSLAKAGVQVVSGMARGIDADSHMGALRAGGGTFAVLAGGVDVVYPRENKYIYDKLLKSGGIISEYPPGTQAIPWQFPARNRIISALSDAVIVIEARIKSGSLITADFAMEQGRDVYALPGRITDKLSTGCNQLILQGAGIISSIDDFVKDFTMFSEISGIQMDFRKNLLEKDETLVYSLLDFCPVSIGTLLEKTPFDLTRIIEILDRLEKLGYVKETFPNYYVQTISVK